VALLLIRHASAGDRDLWTGDDRIRPLDERGRKQADGLVELAADYELERILSSPAVRCVQTVEPLANARRLSIEESPALSEELMNTDGLELVHSLLGAPVAVCCHGGLSVVLAGVGQKKAQTLVLDEDGRVTEQFRP
jgi:8-oxo-dGTP diphosphatase